MSTDGNESQQRLSFQHFDQEFDFGVEDENGERVRKRKRPGRKPNPPSLQERRAQNRAAQKAFRAREQCRKQEKEKQWKAYSDEIIRLKKRLAQVEYEAKYLKGSLLQLSLACLVYRGSVPNVWADTRIYQRGAAEANATAAASEPQHFTSQNGYQGGADTAYNNTNAEINQTPQLLHMILEENNHIVDFEKALAATDISRCSLKVDKKSDQAFHPLNEFINGEVQTMNKEAQQPNKFFPKASSLSIRSFQQKRQSDRNVAPAINTIGFEQTIQLSPLQSPQESPKEDDGALTIHQKPITGVIYEPPTLKTPDDLAAMPSLQALHILRLQLKTSSILGEATPVALLPTALQRVIPHDIRIDYIPGAAIRDRLILFQDYYNADECFQALIQSTIFIGGDVRDAQNWKTDPGYTMKFWFVSHHLFDQSLEDYLDLKTVTTILDDYYSDDRDDKSSKQTVSSHDSPSTPRSAQLEKSTPILLQPDIRFSTSL